MVQVESEGGEGEWEVSPPDALIKMVGIKNYATSSTATQTLCPLVLIMAEWLDMRLKQH